ncbi:hypothetical protein NMY22_g13570 [Coprinellus aureogranulatus]|nr:hypothetical protein NMY22_g13570 [Coprinellus aureogranulatus]
MARAKKLRKGKDEDEVSIPSHPDHPNQEAHAAAVLEGIERMCDKAFNGTISSVPAVNQYHLRARVYPLAVSSANVSASELEDILLEAMVTLFEAEKDETVDLEDEYWEFVQYMPGKFHELLVFMYDIDEAGTRKFMKLLGKSANSSLNDFTSATKEKIPDYVTYNGQLTEPLLDRSTKELRGFRHVDFGEAIVGIADREEYRRDPKAFCTAVLSGARRFVFDSYPSLLYPHDAVYDPHMPEKGLGTGHIILGVLRQELTGPSSVRGKKPTQTQETKAHKWKIEKVTARMVASAAIQAFVACTSLGSYSLIFGQYNVKGLFDSLVRLLSRNDKWAKNTLNQITASIPYLHAAPKGRHNRFAIPEDFPEVPDPFENVLAQRQRAAEREKAAAKAAKHAAASGKQDPNKQHAKQNTVARGTQPQDSEGGGDRGLVRKRPNPPADRDPEHEHRRPEKHLQVDQAPITRPPTPSQLSDKRKGKRRAEPEGESSEQPEHKRARHREPEEPEELGSQPRLHRPPASNATRFLDFLEKQPPNQELRRTVSIEQRWNFGNGKENIFPASPARSEAHEERIFSRRPSTRHRDTGGRLRRRNTGGDLVPVVVQAGSVDAESQQWKQNISPGRGSFIAGVGRQESCYSTGSQIILSRKPSVANDDFNQTLGDVLQRIMKEEMERHGGKLTQVEMLQKLMNVKKNLDSLFDNPRPSTPPSPMTPLPSENEQSPRNVALTEGTASQSKHVQKPPSGSASQQSGAQKGRAKGRQTQGRKALAPPTGSFRPSTRSQTAAVHRLSDPL